MLQAVWILAVAAVFRPARRLHIGRTPRLRADRAQEGGGVESPGTDFHVVRLQQRATLPVPVVLEAQDDLLKGQHSGSRVGRSDEKKAVSKAASKAVAGAWPCARDREGEDVVTCPGFSDQPVT